MDKASDFSSEDCGFESRRRCFRSILFARYTPADQTNQKCTPNTSHEFIGSVFFWFERIVVAGVKPLYVGFRKLEMENKSRANIKGRQRARHP